MNLHPASVRISGAVGLYAARINGIFDPHYDDIHGSKMPLYRNRHDRSCCILYDPSKHKWKMKCIDFNGKTIAKFYNDPGITLDEIAKDICLSSRVIKMEWVVKDGIRYQRYKSAPNMKLELVQN